jgi:hypothetical protein
LSRMTKYRPLCTDADAFMPSLVKAAPLSSCSAAVCEHKAHPRGIAEAALLEIEEKFRNLFNLSNDAVFIHDKFGHMLGVNNRAVAMFGYSHEEILFFADDCISPDSISRNCQKYVQGCSFLIFKKINFILDNIIII